MSTFFLSLVGIIGAWHSETLLDLCLALLYELSLLFLLGPLLMSMVPDSMVFCFKTEESHWKVEKG